MRRPTAVAVCFAVVVCFAVALAAARLPAEVFLLKSGGRIEAEQLNRERERGQPYQLKAADGVRLALAESAVLRVIVKSDLDKQYEALVEKLDNSVASHWNIAEWCLEVGLTEQRKRHLAAIIALEPNHEEARKALGYQRFGFVPEPKEPDEGVNSAGPNAPRPRTYRGFLSLVAHEFFHLWNVKRIRPDALGPFDYTKENYTRSLWVAEGVTDYYARLVLRRAGLISDKEFLKENARAFQGLQNVPGRLVMSTEEASFDTWIKYYRQDENSVNSQVDYYDKGSILGLLLDLEIRKQSQGAKSLDDVMRYLYAEFYRQGRNYTPEDFQRASELMAGSSLEQFFSKYVRGREELDYDSALATVGLRLDKTLAADGSKAVEKAYLGAELVQEGERLRVSRVYAGSPAYEQGLNSGDQIVALNNMRASKEFFDARVAEKHPGDLVSLSIFRADDLSVLLIKLGGRLDGVYRIIPADKPTAEQKRIYQSWLGSTLGG